MYEKIKKANNMMELMRRSFIHLDEDMYLEIIQGSNSPTYGICKLNMVSKKDGISDNHKNVQQLVMK